MDFDSAVEALVSSNGGEEAAPAPSPDPVQTPSTPETATPVDTGATEATTTDSFTSVDVNSLPPELQTLYKSMQADYTRKTQEVAPLRKMAEQYGGVDSVQQGLEFLQAVQSDPQVALAFHGELTKALTDAGLTPAEAAAAASEMVSQQTETEDEFATDDPRDKQLQDLLQWKEQMERDQQLRETEANLTRQEMAIRQAHPEYTDDDVNDIYRLSYSTAGDLNKAAESFETLRQRFIGGYVDSKGTVPTGIGAPATGVAQIPEEGFGSNLEAAHDAARKQFMASLIND